MSQNPLEIIESLLHWAKDPQEGAKPLSDYICTLNKLRVTLLPDEQECEDDEDET